MTTPQTPRQVLATAFDALSVAAIAVLAWRAVFGQEQILDPTAFYVGVLAAAACFMAPGADRRTPWPLLAFASLALLSGWLYGAGRRLCQQIPAEPQRGGACRPGASSQLDCPCGR